jgi:hypothetical protein
MKIYGQAAGSMGGAALGSLFGPAGTYIGAIVGGYIGGVIVSAIPMAQGSTINDIIVPDWNNAIVPRLRWSGRAMLAVKAYHVMRDDAIDQAMAAGATAKWAEAYLDKAGMTLEPTKGRWAPRPDRYNHPLACVSEPCASVKSLTGNPPGSPSGLWSAWGLCGAAEKAGIPYTDCRTYTLQTEGPWPPIGAKGDTIDWGLVGWDEILFEEGQVKSPSGTSGLGIVSVEISMKPSPCDMTAYGINGAPRTKLPISCPNWFGNRKPSIWAADQITKLEKVKAKMLYDLKNPSSSTSSSPGSGLKVVLGGAALAAAIWAAVAFL